MKAIRINKRPLHKVSGKHISKLQPIEKTPIISYSIIEETVFIDEANEPVLDEKEVNDAKNEEAKIEPIKEEITEKPEKKVNKKNKKQASEENNNIEK